MNILKKLLLLTCSISLAHNLYAQESINNSSEAADISAYAPTPQTWAFIRYGSNPVDYYTGKAMVNVPIYTYRDNDFELPISVSYVSEGFVPSRQTGILGLNWFLNCGGAISREIVGIPDDRIYEGLSGFLNGSPASDESIMDLTAGNINSTLTTYQVGGRETTSDIYHFNFLGHSGTFHFNGNKQPKVYNTNGQHGTYTIDTIGYSSGELKGFTIMTADGYKYTFGSADDMSYNNCVERNISGSFATDANFNFAHGNSQTEYPIVTWNLTKIEAPNGRTVEYIYTDVSSTFMYDYVNTDSDNNPFLVMTFVPGDNYSNNHYRNVSITRTCYLDEIIINNSDTVDSNDSKRTSITFSKSLKTSLDRPNSELASGIEYDHNITQSLYKLDAIRVISPNDKLIHNTTFSYNNKDNRLILTKISTDGLGDYTMVYHEEYPYPAISTADTDFWGFYNGNGNSYSDVIGSEVNSNYNDVLKSPCPRVPNWEYARLGCLKRIIYPTKGFTEFEYEANCADKILLKRELSLADLDFSIMDPDDTANSEEEQIGYLVDAHSYSTLFSGTNETGGVRVKKITDYDGLGGLQSRTFSYENGTVHSFPKFYTATINGYQIYNPMLEYPINSLDKQHIGYARVKETFADDSYIVYHYNDYNSHPDEYDEQTRKVIETGGLDDVEDQKWYKYINNVLREPNSNHNKRGKLNCQEFYNAENKLVKKTQYNYAMHDEGYSAYVVLSGKYAYSVKRYIGDYRLTSISNTEYFDNGIATTSQSFSYDSCGRKTATITTGLDGKTVMSWVQYIPSNERHFYNLPEKEFVAQIESGVNPKLRSAISYSYNDQLLPHKVSVANLNDNTACNLEDLLLLTYKDKQTIVSYDDYGNPTEIIDEYGMHTAILWGYNGMYPIVKATNMTAASLHNVLGITSNAPLAGALDSSKRSTLYNLSNTLIEIYEYEPLVGMTKHYDNNGKCTTYGYDSYGRLISISDIMGNVQRYVYNMSGTNSPSLDLGDDTIVTPINPVTPPIVVTPIQ